MKKINENTKVTLTFGQLKRLVLESSSPSKLKLKDTSKTREYDEIVGDVYDVSDDNRVRSSSKYSSQHGTGFITDKAGNSYEVIAGWSQEDAGRIAGGSIDYYCTIKNVYGKDIIISGYSAVFSHNDPTSQTIVSDLEGGMFLEDYLAKHESDIKFSSKTDKVKELIANGDPNVRLYSTVKADASAERAKKRKALAIKIKPSFIVGPDGKLISNHEIENASDDEEKQIDALLRSMIEPDFNSRDYSKFIEGIKLEMEFNIDNSELSFYPKHNILCKIGKRTPAIYRGFHLYCTNKVTRFARSAFLNHIRDTNYREIKLMIYSYCFNDKKNKKMSNPTELVDIPLNGKIVRHSLVNWKEEFAANTKMQAWAAGKRKENLKLCSPEKLALYYYVCIKNDLYDNAEIIQDVAASKNLIVY